MRAGYVARTDAPASMCEQGGWGRVGCGIAIVIRYIEIHQSRWFSHRSGSVTWTDAPVCLCALGGWGRGGCGLGSTIRYT
jgi:hypothetical protein